MDNKRSAIVMGATSGIGYEVTLILARRGWRIGVAGRREDILAKMSGEIDGIVAYEILDDGDVVGCTPCDYLVALVVVFACGKFGLLGMEIDNHGDMGAVAHGL